MLQHYLRHQIPNNWQVKNCGVYHTIFLHIFFKSSCFDSVMFINFNGGAQIVQYEGTGIVKTFNQHFFQNEIYLVHLLTRVQDLISWDNFILVLSIPYILGFIQVIKVNSLKIGPIFVHSMVHIFSQIAKFEIMS